MRMVADGSSVRRIDVTALIWSTRLDPSGTLCAYDMHGRCASQPCKDTHVDLHLSNWSDAEIMDAVIADFRRHNEASGCATPNMLQNGIESAAIIAHRALANGATLNTCVPIFLAALVPMSRVKLRTERKVGK